MAKKQRKANTLRARKSDLAPGAEAVRNVIPPLPISVRQHNQDRQELTRKTRTQSPKDA